MSKRLTRTRTSTAFHQMVDDVPVSITRRGHINECCFCGARHRSSYADDGRGGLTWTTRVIRKGRMGRKPW
jgi:hypothetical protein